MATRKPGPPKKRVEEVDRRASKDPVPQFTEESAERTEVTFAPVFGDDDLVPAETTDRNEIPKLERKLRLPMPGEADPDPAPRPAKPAKPVVESKARPIEREEPELRPVKVYAAEPAGSGNLILGIVGVLLIVVMVAFAIAPEGKSESDLQAQQAAEHRRAYDNLVRERATITPSGGSETGGGVLPTRSTFAERAAPKRRPAVVPEVKRTGHEVIAAADPKDVRLGIQPAEDRGARRQYDNYDSAVDRGNGIPMLMVFSTPPGMSVDVEGKLMGMTPLLRALAKDTKRVKLRVYGAGYREWSETVTANEIEQFKVGVTMEPIPK